MTGNRRRAGVVLQDRDRHLMAELGIMRIIDRETGVVLYGRVPAWSVVVPGTMPGKPLPDGTPGPGLYCAVIVKRVDEKTRARVSINELLRA